MGQFFVVSGTGRTGTSWLAEALNHPKAGIVCSDEGKLAKPVKVREILKSNPFVQLIWKKYFAKYDLLDTLDKRLLGKDTWLESWEYELHHGLGQRYSGYFKSLKSQLRKYVAVGDSHSWDPHLLPQVNRLIPVSKIIYLVRNGIPNVNALDVHNTELFEQNPIFRNHFARYTEMFGGSCTSAWEHWCFWWSINSKVPEWFRENLPDTEIEVFRLEDLTSDNSRLASILEGLAPGSSSKVGDLNNIISKNDDRDSTGSRAPETIWDKWPEEHRQIFRIICGDTMEHYGYAVP